MVAIADRLDSIAGAFSVGYVPTGSEDPYGLRRSVHGISRIIYENILDLLFDEAIEHAFKGYLYTKIETKKAILDFIAGRLRPILLGKGIRYDVADAVLFGFNAILDVFEKAAALNPLLNEKWLTGVIASADRISRIAGKAPRDQVLEHDLAESEEKALYDLYLKINWEVSELVNKEKWAEAAAALAKLTDPIERFFDKVMVMHQHEL